MKMKNSYIIIREALIPEDYQAVVNLWSTAGPGIHLGPSDSLEEIEKKQLRDPDLFLIAELDGDVIGAVMGGFDGRRGIVYHLAVSEPYRKQGIGRSLMAELETRLHLKGCIRSYLMVTTDNQENVDFYINQGWSKLDLFILGKDIR